MINAYEADAIETAPDLSKLLSVGYPTNGNPNTGTPATLPGAAWFYMITAELMSVLTTADVTPDRNKVDQLITAITKLIDSKAAATLPAGTILPYAGKIVPPGFFWCNDSTFDEELYPNLYSALGTNKLPDLRDRTIWGANTADDVGKYLEDGLPNVQGSCHFLRYNGADDLDSVIKNGAFTLTVSYRDTAKQNGAVFGSTLFNFNAGNYNAIYGKANNVRVSSAQFLMIIKA